MADDLAALGAGALFGLGAQAASDLVHGQVSGWKDYAASAVGGAVAAEAALYSGGLASGAAGGAAYSATKQLLEKGGIDAGALAKDAALGAVGGKAGQLAGKALGSGANALARTLGGGAAGAATGAGTQVAANAVQGRPAFEGVGEATLVGGITGAVTGNSPGPKSAKQIGAENAGRLPQDAQVNPTPPAALPTGRPVGNSPTQNAAAQAEVQRMRQAGYTDIRVNQQQVNAQGQRVGINRPDLQGTSPAGRREYIEYDTSSSRRGAAHADRIRSNDPDGTVQKRKVD